MISNQSFTCRSTPKVLRTRERALTPYSSVVLTLNSHLNISNSLGGASFVDGAHLILKLTWVMTCVEIDIVQ